MDHPSEEWKDIDSYPVELKAVRRKDMRKHIHFAGLKSDYDYMSCFYWEYHRTLAFIDFKYGDKHSERNHFFPFTENTFPLTPYLSHPLATRRLWFKKQGEGQYKHEEELLAPFGEVNEEIETNDPIFKIPLTLHVNPNWGLEKFVKLVRDQWASLEQQVQGDVKRLEAKSYHVEKTKPKRAIVSWKKCLKLLGCYRLYHCVGLSWAMTRDEYGLNKNASEDRFRSDCKKNLSLLLLP